jgi:hypothetical protein
MPNLIPQLEHPTLQSLLSIYSEIVADFLTFEDCVKFFELVQIIMIRGPPDHLRISIHEFLSHQQKCMPKLSWPLGPLHLKDVPVCHQRLDVTERSHDGLTVSLVDTGKSGRLSAAQVPSKRDSLVGRTTMMPN